MCWVLLQHPLSLNIIFKVFKILKKQTSDDNFDMNNLLHRFWEM